MNLITITDINNKQFTIDTKKYITYISDDMSSEANIAFAGDFATSNDEENNFSPIELNIVDSDGNPFNVNDTESKESIVSIDAYIEATHSGQKINNAYYTGDSMLRDAQSYVFPFKKPLIKNHDSNSEPIGRIIEADCIDSVICEGSKAVNVVANVTDKDAIEKFMDGRYSTVSIGAYPNTITCNHCGKHILKDGKFKFCGHFRGEVYDDKKCTWKMEDLEYVELSVVNSPADRLAQVYRIKVNTKTNSVTDTEEDGNKIINAITDLEEPTVEDNVNVEENTTEDSDNEEGIDLTEDLKPTVPLADFMELQDKLDDSKNKVAVLEADNQSLEEQFNVLSNFLDELVNTALSKSTKDFSEDASIKDRLREAKAVINSINLESESTVVTTTDNIVVSVKTVANPSLVNNNDEKVITDKEEEKTEPNGIANKKLDNNEKRSELNLLLDKYN